MAISLNDLTGGANYGLTTPPPTKQQLNTQFYNKNIGGNLLQSYSNPVAQATKNAPSSNKSSGGGSNPGGSGGNNYTSGSYDPTTLTQAQRQSLWEANGHSGTAPIGYGGEGGNATDPAAAMQEEILNDYKTQNSAYTKALSDYQKANPFSFDDMLKQESVKAKGNISPYYDEILNNYLTGVDYLKGNTIEDENRALTKLQADHDAFTGQSKALLDTTLTRVGQDYGNAGSYDSGARARAQGVEKANEQYQEESANRQYQYDTGSTQIQANRVLNQEIPLQTTQEKEQVANQEASDVNTQAQQLATYDQQKYNYLSQEAAVAGVPAVGKYGTPNTIPGLSSAQTQETLQGLLPNVQVSSFGGAQATPILGYA